MYGGQEAYLRFNGLLVLCISDRPRGKFIPSGLQKQGADTMRADENPLKSQPLSPERDRIRCYHEAGHALLALHFGVNVKEIWGGDVARTINDEETYKVASPRVRAMLALAGGVTEDVVFGQRSPGCCDGDLTKAEKILDEIAAPGIELGGMRAALEGEARRILSQPVFRSALDILALEIETAPFVVGTWALELLARKCPEIGPHLRVPLPVVKRHSDL